MEFDTPYEDDDLYMDAMMKVAKSIRAKAKRKVTVNLEEPKKEQPKKDKEFLKTMREKLLITLLTLEDSIKKLEEEAVDDVFAIGKMRTDTKALIEELDKEIKD
jgi:hypothetical protein